MVDVKDLLNNVADGDDKVDYKDSSSFFDDLDDDIGVPKIKIIGVGGAGNNIVKFLSAMRVWPKNIEIVGINTDVQALKKIKSNFDVVLIGKKLLNGFGSGGKAEIGSLAFQESKENLSKIIDGADVLFLIAGLGKGTGSGVTPELAKLAKDKNITTVAIVTLPSISTEGDKVYTNAVVNYEKVKQNSDCICTISNDKILLSDKKLSLIDEFKKGNEEIGSIINDFVDIITETYEFNIDFADLRNFLKENKHFVHLHLRSEENNMKDLKESFEKAIKNSYSSIVFAQDKPVNLLANFKITPKTTSLPKELKDIISAHAKNRNISFVYGLDAENNSLIDISIFASIEEQAIEKSDTSYQKNESEEESMLNETKMIVEQYKTTSVPTVQKNSFSFEMEDDEDNN